MQMNKHFIDSTPLVYTFAWLNKIAKPTNQTIKNNQTNELEPFFQPTTHIAVYTLTMR